tara:strand:+ start:1300 stop:1545 length:246 start_codon:yes stop_codon:yes gene_type:complete
VLGLPDKRRNFQKQQKTPTRGSIRLAEDGSVKMKKGLYANIHAKRKRIKAGSGEKMRKPGTKGAPTRAAFKASAKTARKRK